MGTRADFYIGRGKDAEWLGSIAWDGYPEGIDKPLLHATTKKAYRDQIAEFFKDRKDVTLPDMGWPWPWDDSGTTDYAYAFDDGKVWASPYGHGWFDPLKEEPEDRSGKVEFPDMSHIKNVSLDGRSGLIIFSR